MTPVAPHHEKLRAGQVPVEAGAVNGHASTVIDDIGASSRIQQHTHAPRMTL